MAPENSPLANRPWPVIGGGICERWCNAAGKELFIVLRKIFLSIFIQFSKNIAVASAAGVLCITTALVWLRRKLSHNDRPSFNGAE